MPIFGVEVEISLSGKLGDGMQMSGSTVFGGRACRHGEFHKYYAPLIDGP